MAILIIEDREEHFDKLSNFIKTYADHTICYPESTKENERFINSLRSWLSEKEWTAGQPSLDGYLRNDISVIILDMRLEESLKTQSGIQVLTEIRKNERHKFTPVLILTIDNFEEVEKCFTSHDVVANYYLNKALDGEVLTDKFLHTKLLPIISMLTYWKAVALGRADIGRLIEINSDKLLEAISHQYGLLDSHINVKSEEIITLSKILLRIIQSQVRASDPRLHRLVENFVGSFEGYNFDAFPNVQKKQDQIVEALFKSKDTLIRILQEGAEDAVKEEFMDYVKRTIKEIAGCDEDSSLTLAISTLVYRSIASTWKFISFNKG